ncbi:LysR family transcriptional regulator [Niveibacterium sp. SC-1]|uniref:LysR family transcriptional regulator n=1 Tax=Niveibacterium sp. SC-1 TaxID=3135646 RepID=UPI00311FB320
MYHLDELRLFVRTAETLNLSAAGRELGLSAALASATLKRLEATLGVQLFVRSTRAMQLTNEGRLFLEPAGQALALLEQAGNQLSGAREEITGPLRISAPAHIGRRVLRPWLDDFMATHPAVEISLLLSDRLSDLTREPVDAALRYGSLEDTEMVARRLAQSWRVLVASPDYLARHGVPRSPADLAQHLCLQHLIYSRSAPRWRLVQGKQSVEAEFRASRASDDGSVLADWAMAGHGIALKPVLDVVEELANGQLVRVLPRWKSEASPLQLVYPHRKLALPRLRALIGFLETRFAARARQADVR